MPTVALTGHARADREGVIFLTAIVGGHPALGSICFILCDGNVLKRTYFVIGFAGGVRVRVPAYRPTVPVPRVPR